MKYITCPICEGDGKIPKPKTKGDFMNLKVKAAKILRQQGFSIGAIQAFMRYKSKRGVTYLLSK